MKLAIVGAHGFVGSHVAAEAMRRGWIVTSIGRNTPLTELHNVDAVIHTVGSFMEDQRYKKLISKPVSISSLAKLAAIKLGLDPPNPMLSHNTFMSLNYEPVEKAALALKPTKNKSKKLRTPFVYISAADWPMADPRYLASKRKAEQLLTSLSYLRPVFLRPGFISAKKPGNCSGLTPRGLVDSALLMTNSPFRVSVQTVAELACDAAEDQSVEGAVDCEVLRHADTYN